MNELQRQTYLKTFGIVSYMPRVQLPHAPASTQVTPSIVALAEVRPRLAGLVDAQAEPAPVIASPASSADTGRVAAEVAALVDQVESRQVRSSTRPAIPDIKPAAPVAREASCRFSLGIWRLSELLIVDSRQSGLALPTDALLRNLLLALFGRKIVLPRVEIFNWPVKSHQALDASAAAARDALAGMLSGYVEQAPISNCLILGCEAATYLCDGDTGPSFGEANVDGVAHPAIVVPSLAEMLQAPELKSVAWRELSSLRARLKGAENDL